MKSRERAGEAAFSSEGKSWTERIVGWLNRRVVQTNCNAYYLVLTTLRLGVGSTYFSRDIDLGRCLHHQQLSRPVKRISVRRFQRGHSVHLASVLWYTAALLHAVHLVSLHSSRPCPLQRTPAYAQFLTMERFVSVILKSRRR